VRNRDTQLADLVADFCMGKIEEMPEDEGTLELIADCFGSRAMVLSDGAGLRQFRA
jgi:hypothetical protein